MEPGVLYVSFTYSTAGHICPCGCGQEVVTKLSPARWQVIFDGEISLSPSVAATGLPCNSHYFITRGAVDWHPKLDARQASEAQAADRRAVGEHRTAAPSGWLARLRRRCGIHRAAAGCHTARQDASLAREKAAVTASCRVVGGPAGGNGFVAVLPAVTAGRVIMRISRAGNGADRHQRKGHSGRLALRYWRCPSVTCSYRPRGRTAIHGLRETARHTAAA